MFHNNDRMTEDRDGEADATHHRTIRRSGWFTTTTLFLLSALLCVVFAEVTARAFWYLRYGVPFLNPGRILYAFYPELQKVEMERPAHGDEFYDILFLGGSVLNPYWGQVAQALQEELAFEGHRNVRIFNLATTAHSSRDSRLKYAAISEARFELVVFYHGINETRANNAPPEIFREDYSHYSWYEIVNTMASYHGRTSFALSYTLHYLVMKLRRVLMKDRYVPIHNPREDWVHYGGNPRSSVSFKHNLGAILDLAKHRGDRVLLMTFATYMPEDYSLKGFEKKRLDYGLHHAAIEMWGAPDHVLKTVAVHNEIVRGLAADQEGVLFVDQASLMAGVGRYFNDVCHFTVVGSSKFAEYMLMGLLPSLQRFQRAQGEANGRAGDVSKDP
jgi:hypothetical protein